MLVMQWSEGKRSEGGWGLLSQDSVCLQLGMLDPVLNPRWQTRQVPGSGRDAGRELASPGNSPLRGFIWSVSSFPVNWIERKIWGGFRTSEVKLLNCVRPRGGRQKAPGLFFWVLLFVYLLLLVFLGLLVWVFLIGELYTASHCPPTTVASSAALRTALTLFCMRGAALMPNSWLRSSLTRSFTEVKRIMCIMQPISNRIFFMLLTVSSMLLVVGFQKDSLVVHCRWYRLKSWCLHTVFQE